MPFTLHPLPPLPRAQLCDVQHWPFPKTRYDLESLLHGWRLSGDIPMRPGKIPSLMVTLPNEQHINVPEAIVQWADPHEHDIETKNLDLYTKARLERYVRRLTHEPMERGASETSIRYEEVLLISQKYRRHSDA